MRRSWISFCGLLTVLCTVMGTFSHHASFRCHCNGKSRFCVTDAHGLRCVQCRGNADGRHCERCKEGYYQQGAGQSCMPCRCVPAGSVSSKCDSRGRCRCKEGLTGDKCDRCLNGEPAGLRGCTQRRQVRDDERQSSLCFCFGHSSRCSAARGFAANTITSTFSHGPEEWRPVTSQGGTPADVHFRWSPKYQDIEVIAANSLPIYLKAPSHYLGNQLLSYGQNLSFSLRLDRGVRHPSTSDVVLEGSGLRVAASLGEPRSIIPCAQKITYSFRLDEQTSSKWKPHLSAFQFQTLLQNLTNIKIRGTFGGDGRGYLDNVRLDSAHQGTGEPATWIQSCSCPQGYEGNFCERCASGYKRRSPGDGAFSPCEPCNCRGGSCDPDTGDCFSADETPDHQSCSPGFYKNPEWPQSCVRCPCPSGVSCSLDSGSLEVRCDQCPAGTTGSRCDVCADGFYGDPLAEGGLQRPCRPCSCNGHVDPNALGICDTVSGKCLKCLNATTGGKCELCLDGYYHSQPAEACRPCDCDPRGSAASRCSDRGQCQCREGFEGLRCQRSTCPYCFNPIKTKVEDRAAKLRDLERQFSDMDGGSLPVHNVQMEAALRAAEELLSDLQANADRHTASERGLQRRLSAVSQSQLTEGRDIQALSHTVDSIQEQQQSYQEQAAHVHTLIQDMKRKLEEAKSSIQSAEFPLGDAGLGTDALSTLVQKASGLAERHQNKADVVERTANEALRDSDKSLALVRTLMNKENKVKELLGDLRTMYDDATAQVKNMENQAARLSGEARGESKMAEGMLKQITAMQSQIPTPLQEDMDTAVSRMDSLKEQLDKKVSSYQALQRDVEQDRAAVEKLLAQGRGAQQDYEELLARANAARADTADALQGITDNMDGLDDALATLRGFDGQIDKNRALADAAIQKLPAINATIQQAVGTNSQTLAILGSVSDDYSDALGTVSQLETVVSGLEELSGSLPSSSGLVTGATDLKESLQGLSSQAEAVEAEVAAEMERVRKQEGDAEEASVGAAGALSNARQTRDAVAETLQAVNNLLSVIGQPGSLDEERLNQLESQLADARSRVNQRLKPRLLNMEDKEEAQRSRLDGLNLDIDNILRDITNLEDILRTVPNGCYNSPPIERP
ncbi:laminin subunit gamma-2 [Lampris incognitus]|uniref:laminin subunit gamma-2 n=1 Tax=Lampris incognitus TaxID=2546036 RepID=UPI0024B61A0D|nr:laminin subunit gamma-2 [Lampris incognitus]